MEQENFFNRYSDITSDLIEGNLDEKPCEFSFVITAYKNPKALRRILEAMLAQKGCPKFEVLIADDSADEAEKNHEVVKEFINRGVNILYYKNRRNLGMFGNYSRVFELSRSEYCCYFNHDDAPTPDYLARVSQVLSKEDFDSLRVGTDIIRDGVILNNKGFFNTRYFNRPGHIQRPTFKYFLYRGCFSPSGNCMKRSVVFELGGYDERFYPVSDYEFDARLLSKYKVGILWERLCKVYTDDSTSNTREFVIGASKFGWDFDKRIYNEIFDFKGKYDWLAAARYCYGHNVTLDLYRSMKITPPQFQKRFKNTILGFGVCSIAST